jgi:Na+-transporting NADH:ubiquinone oxidoreductase subunit NqrB
MKIINLYRILLNIGVSVLLVAFLFRIMHWPGGTFLWNISYFLTIAYVIVGIIIVLKDQGKEALEKGAWTIGFILLPPIIGIIYYHLEMKRKIAST